jgi:hypothetical protein
MTQGEGTRGFGDACCDGGFVDGALDHGFVQVMAPLLAWRVPGQSRHSCSTQVKTVSAAISNIFALGDGMAFSARRKRHDPNVGYHQTPGGLGPHGTVAINDISR